MSCLRATLNGIYPVCAYPATSIDWKSEFCLDYSTRDCVFIFSMTRKKKAALNDRSLADLAAKQQKKTEKRRVKRQRLKENNSKKNEGKDQNTTVGKQNRNAFLDSIYSVQDSTLATNETMTDYGQNRLKSGFQKLPPPDDSDEEGQISENDKEVYEIDSTDEDGGITLNMQGQGDDPITISDDDDQNETQTKNQAPDSNSLNGRTSITTTNDVEAAKNLESPNETLSKGSLLTLKDLSRAQLEDQFTYAFWHLKREQIDLNVPVRCLHCGGEGHLDGSCSDRICVPCNARHPPAFCPQMRSGTSDPSAPCTLCNATGHLESACEARHRLPTNKSLEAEQIELWISCCNCASKSHLVGDCPRLRSETGHCWSLRTLDPSQVTNLSVLNNGSMNKSRRDMRPEGLKIKGRAHVHHATKSPPRRDSDDSDDMQKFLNHPPSRFRQANDDKYRPSDAPRYDRYAAPSSSEPYRPPRNVFYNTDSFGRKRSRSPPQQGAYTGDSRNSSRRSSPSLSNMVYSGTRSGQGFRMQIPPQHNPAPLASRVSKPARPRNRRGGRG